MGIKESSVTNRGVEQTQVLLIADALVPAVALSVEDVKQELLARVVDGHKAYK